MLYGKGMLLGLLGTLAIGTASASAQEVLAQYDFVGGSPAATTTGTITGTDAVLGPFSFGSSTPSIDALGAFVPVSATNTPVTGVDSLADAIAGGDFLSFTIDTDSASPFSFSQISYTYSTASTSGFSLSSHLLTSATGFTAADALQTTNRTTNGSSQVVVDVSGETELQGLTGPVEVRVYFSDSTFVGGPSHRLDTIEIQGVPEPGSLALLGVGGFCVLWRRRRRS